MKFELTKESKKTEFGVTLYRIKALKDFLDVKKGNLGGWVEKESNLSQDGDAWVYGDAWVSGNARVSGDARVYGNARIEAKKAYKAGWFIGGSDSDKITNITDETGSEYWRNQYVLGDYEIEDIEEDTEKNSETDKLDELKEEMQKLLDKIKKLEDK